MLQYAYARQSDAACSARRERYRLYSSIFCSARAEHWTRVKIIWILMHNTSRNSRDSFILPPRIAILIAVTCHEDGDAGRREWARRHCALRIYASICIWWSIECSSCDPQIITPIASVENVLYERRILHQIDCTTYDACILKHKS